MATETCWNKNWGSQSFPLTSKICWPKSCRWKLLLLLLLKCTDYSEAVMESRCRGFDQIFSINRFWTLFVMLVFNGTFSTNRPYCAIGVWNILCIDGEGNTLFHLGFVEIISSPHEDVIRGVFFIANHLTTTDNLTKTTNTHEHNIRIQSHKKKPY